MYSGARSLAAFPGVCPRAGPIRHRYPVPWPLRRIPEHLLNGANEACACHYASATRTCDPVRIFAGAQSLPWRVRAPASEGELSVDLGRGKAYRP